MSIFDRDETPVRVSFTLPRHILDDLDEYAEAAKLPRSKALRNIIHARADSVDLDDIRMIANAPPSKYESVKSVASRLNAEGERKGK